MNPNDDIDIDIDFTTGQMDEDEMLDDVGSDVEFTQGYEPQIVSDDIMAVDDNPSFPMEELHHDEDEQLQDIPEENMDLPEMETLSDLPLDSDNTDRRDSSHGAEVSVPDLTAQFEGEEISNTVTDVNQGVSPRGSPHAEDAVETSTFVPEPAPVFQPGSLVDANTLCNSPENTANQTSTNNSRQQILPKEEAKDFFIDTENENSKSLGQAVGAPDFVAQDEIDVKEVVEEQTVDDQTVHEQTVNEDTVNEEVVYEGSVNGETVGEQTMDEEQSFMIDAEATYSGMIVTYRNSQYALFSSSEDEDLDSFFLKDRSVMREPISSFLKSLRGILQAELDDDDELCIAIDVLRLEFGERSAEIDNVTFDGLIYVHQQLIRNDGIESPEPLHFTLGTRPEFKKRYAGLLAGAHEGKGLSKLIPRDEESENCDDNDTSTHVDEEYDPNRNEDQSISATGEGPEFLEYQTGVEEESNIDYTSAPHELDSGDQDQSIRRTEEENEEDEHKSENLTNRTSPTPADSSSMAIPVPAENSFAIAEPQDVHSKRESEASNVVHEEQPDEEGDLIDYGEDEDDNTKPTASPPNLNNAEYKAKDEEHRRRSLAQAAEDEATEDASTTGNFDEATTAINHEAEQAEAQESVHETNAEDEIDYEDDTKVVDDLPHDNHENQEVEDVDAASAPDESGEAYYAVFDEQEGSYDEEYDLENGVNDGNHYEGGDRNFAVTTEALTVITSAGGDFASLKSNGVSPHEEISAESGTFSAVTVEPDEIDYDVDDLSPGEKSASKHHQSHDSMESQELDEIDYDDDDVGDVAPPSPKASSMKSASSSTPAKRQRSDSLSEATAGEASQEAKRIRS